MEKLNLFDKSVCYDAYDNLLPYMFSLRLNFKAVNRFTVSSKDVQLVKKQMKQLLNILFYCSEKVPN